MPISAKKRSLLLSPIAQKKAGVTRPWLLLYKITQSGRASTFANNLLCLRFIFPIQIETPINTLFELALCIAFSRLNG
jgi:hypothetical protein